ncbi:hypothetical protein P3T76_001071 [Phytophthora citrophthora]|uniref:MULE transposase domain-containing protein n=1 Tax=Phytophthora citrophthora TaxID=4793 RepID=A0AAD9LSK4_9STRA|nr:hypothetical protein P3T76_001071 [Phytophthora citrophthora]
MIIVFANIFHASNEQNGRVSILITRFLIYVSARVRHLAGLSRPITCIEFALGKQPNPVDVVCDFESALINAIQKHYPSTRLIGCYFHFKQACRRKMKEYALPDGEVGVAMLSSPGKIVEQGVAWVKAKVKPRLDAKDLPYSRNKWKQFWRYLF